MDTNSAPVPSNTEGSTKDECRAAFAAVAAAILAPVT